jgi:hypothetical protein
MIDRTLDARPIYLRVYATRLLYQSSLECVCMCLCLYVSVSVRVTEGFICYPPGMTWMNQMYTTTFAHILVTCAPLLIYVKYDHVCHYYISSNSFCRIIIMNIR